MREAGRGSREWWMEAQGEEDFRKGRVPLANAMNYSGQLCLIRGLWIWQPGLRTSHTKLPPGLALTGVSEMRNF